MQGIVNAGAKQVLEVGDSPAALAAHSVNSDFSSSTGFKVGVPIASIVALAALMYATLMLWRRWKRRRATCKVKDASVYTQGTFQDTFDNSSVGDEVQEWCPRMHPITAPDDSSIPAKLNYIEKELDTFSQHDLMHKRYRGLGPNQRMRGGSSPDVLVTYQHYLLDLDS